MNANTPINSQSARDVNYVLHPYTNARVHETKGPIIIERGKGVYVYDDQGKEYIEGLAGLWSVALGFGEERLVQAAADQMRKLPYYHTFASKSHNPSIDLAEKLVSMAPSHLKRVFFTNSGSEANDTVMKIVWYWNNALGRPKKKKFVARIRGYHGITIASGSLTGLPWNHRDFDLPIANVLHTACPHHYRFAHEGESEEDFASRLANQLQDMIDAEGADTIAAFIGEPVMGAGGVIVPPATYWEKIQAVCRKHDILVVADEVINGFGRTGTTFACERYQITPDVLVLSKQITSSYMPLAAILMTDQIYQGLADNTARIGTFGHGFTASGHPVATAVALENLKIIEERGIIEHAQRMEPLFQQGLRKFASHPLVGEARGVGLIGAVELVADKATKRQFDPIGKVGAYLYERGHHHGLIVRNIQDNVAMCPPMIIKPEEIAEMFRRFELALADTWAWVQENGLQAPK